VKEGPLDRTALEHGALGRVELVEPSRQEGLDRRRYRYIAVRGVAEKADHLLHEERVALRCLANSLAERSGQRRIRRHALDQRVRFVTGEALECNRRCIRHAAPARTMLQ
jgi:hypothetical protein